MIISKTWQCYKPKYSNQSKVKLSIIVGILIIITGVCDLFRQDLESYDFMSYNVNTKSTIYINSYIKSLEKISKEFIHKENYVIYEKLSFLYEKRGEYKKNHRNTKDKI